ncbi:MAG: hypothetical protein U0166_00530 [Acidobacteriota bacterium]
MLDPALQTEILAYCYGCFFSDDGPTADLTKRWPRGDYEQGRRIIRNAQVLEGQGLLKSYGMEGHRVTFKGIAQVWERRLVEGWQEQMESFTKVLSTLAAHHRDALDEHMTDWPLGEASGVEGRRLHLVLEMLSSTSAISSRSIGEWSITTSGLRLLDLLRSAVDSPPPSGNDATSRYSSWTLVDEDETGRIWRVHDGLLDRDVAVKFFEDEIEYARLAPLQTRVTHPHILPVYDLPTLTPPGETRARPCMVMALCQGTMTRFLHGLPDRESLRIFGLDLIDGLHAIHAKGFFHTDLHPGNVLFMDGRALVMDLDYERLSSSTKEYLLRRDLDGAAFLLMKLLEAGGVGEAQRKEFRRSCATCNSMVEIRGLFDSAMA